MATFRLLHVTRTGGDTDGLAEFTNSDTVLMPVHSSDPLVQRVNLYNSSDDKLKIYDGFLASSREYYRTNPRHYWSYGKW